MNKRKKDSLVNVGNISDVSGGQINIAGGNISVSQSHIHKDEIAAAFASIMKAIDKIPEGPEKNIAQSALKGLENEAKKSNDINKNKVEKWFQFLAQTAPDAFDVAIDTFIHPIKGLHTIFQKIAMKAKETRG